MDRPHDFSGKLALVTGASRGIGHAVALRLASAGAHVVAVARTSGALEALDDEIRDQGGQAALLVPGDLTQQGFVEQLASSLYDRFGRLDVLVGNAATLGPLTPLTHLAEKDWHEVLTLNLEANWRLIRVFHPLLQLAKQGRAVFVTSGAARSAKAFWGGYSVSKAGLEALVRIYAAECANTNIRVNLIDPGAVDTNMRRQAYPGEDRQRLGRPERVAELFATLASSSCTRHGEVVRAE